MNHKEGFFTGVREKEIYYQAWLPEGEVKAVLLIVHGMAEHSGRYGNVVDHFVPQGYAVYGLDHVGHGKSEGTRVYVDGFEDFTDTLKMYYDMIREWQPEKPIFLVGHSMGSLISSTYLLDHQDDLAGAILSGVLVKVPEDISPVVVFMGNVLSSLAPKMGLMKLDATAVSQDPAVVDAYVNDPLVYTGKYTTRLGAELIKAMERVSAHMSAIRIPLLLLQGGADKLVDPSGAKMLYAKAGSEDKTLKIYEGFYHEVYNEPGRDQVLEDMEAWLE
ncbi:MAG: Monoacylglycerol lipase [Chloroflexi bacterium]|nr:Monoacylglycerol lipase [Chloroflexota bacterium]